MVLDALPAPGNFFYGVIGFAMSAPHDWYAANGLADRLTLLGKTIDAIRYSARGATLLGLLLLCGHRLAAGRTAVDPPGRLLGFLIVAGVAAALLPSPVQIQYLMPLLPPLFIALGRLIDTAQGWQTAPRRVLLALLLLSAGPGLTYPFDTIRDTIEHGAAPMEATRTAQWIGRQVRHARQDGAIATLSPQLAADSGIAIDPRFAVGPFLFRSGALITADRARTLRAMTPATLGDLDRDPPAAVLAGDEGAGGLFHRSAEAPLIHWAQQRGYRPVAAPDGRTILYLRP